MRHSILDALSDHALRRPHGRAWAFLDADLGIREAATYSQLRHAASLWAGLVGSRARPGDRAVLAFEPGLAFAEAFLGTLAAGVVAVPARPPTRRGAERFRAIVADCEPALVLASPSLSGALAEALGGAVPVLDERALGAPAAAPATPAAGALAFLQYTSGSTATPRGVMVTHGAIAANEEAIRACFGHDADSRILGWLPVYHDMGLIGTLLQPLWVGAAGHLMSPAHFLREPLSWLRAIDRYRITTSGGPNFAYDLCADAPGAIVGLDLSTWRVAFNGAEPVRAATLARFAERFAPTGFDPAAFLPCYGLAEATLFVTGKPAADAPVERRVLEEGEAPRRIAAADGGEGAEAVSSGRVFPGTRVAIVDPGTRAPRPDGVEGEIWVRGESVASGYWRRPDESTASFGATLEGDGGGEGGWLRTGDLGIRDAGELVVTGRIKDLIILRGRNVHPQDIEAAAVAAHAAVRTAGAAAFAAGEAGAAAIAVEVAREARAKAADVARAVAAEVARACDVALEAVHVLRPGALPKTTSGKVQRSLTRRLLERGALEALHVWRRGAEGSAPEATSDAPEAPLSLRARLARAARLPEAEIAEDAPLAALGVDSLALAELCHALARDPGVRIAPAELAELTPARLAARLAEAAPRRTSVEEPSAAPPPVWLAPTPGQRRFLVLDALGEGRDDQGVAATLTLDGPLDAARLARAVGAAAARHPMLRLAFAEVGPAAGGGPEARLRPDAGVGLEDLGSATDEAAARALWRERARAPFDRASGPLARAGLVALGPERALLGLAADHIVCDGWSMRVLAREILALYAADGPAALPPPGDPFAALRPDADAERAALARATDRLAGAPTLLALPADGARGGAAQALEIDVDPALVADLRRMAGRLRVSPAALWLAAFGIVLARVADVDDLLVGTPVARRDAPGADAHVGLFLDLLPVRLRLPQGSDLEGAARAVAAALADARTDEAASLDALVDALAPGRAPGARPLFQVLFNHLPDARPGGAAGPLRWRLEPMLDIGAKFDLTLYVAEAPARTSLVMSFDAGLMRRARVETLAAQVLGVAARLVRTPDAPWRTTPLREPVPAAEARPATDHGYPWSGPLQDRVAAFAAGPGADRPALVDARGLALRYGALVRRADAFAARLAAAGLRPGETVAILAERDAALPFAILATLRAGGVFGVLDAAYPDARLARMLDVARPRLLLAAGIDPARAAEIGGGADLLVVPDPFEAPDDALGFAPATVGPDDPACLTFTSGTSGTPLGVVGRHGGLVAFMPWQEEAFGLSRDDRVSLLSGLSHDPLQRDVATAWWAGGTLCIAPREALAQAGVARRWLAEAGVTIANLTPSVARLVTAGENEESGTPLARLRLAFLVGEALRAADVARLRRLAPGCEVVGLYGATETARVLLHRRIPPGVPVADPIPLGDPPPHADVLLVGPDGAPVDVGEPGEIVLRSRAIALGYAGAAETGADAAARARFGTDESGVPLYRTGDIARRTPDGALVLSGRRDRQVKIRGVRIELGEIEAAAEALGAGPAHARVLAGAQRLVLYVAAATPLEPERLRRDLAARLPAAAVPDAVVLLDALPRTPNGKIDEAALPLPGARTGTPPRPGAEARLAEIWRRVLGVETVHREDGFVALGGHSLRAVEAQAEIGRAFGRSPRLPELMDGGTLAEMAAGLSGPFAGAADTRADETPPAVVAHPEARHEPFPLNDIQRAYWIGRRPGMGHVGVGAQSAYAFACPHVDVARLEAAWTTLVRRHDMLRAVVDEDGTQRVLPEVPPVAIPVHGVGADAEGLATVRAVLRERLETRTFDASRWPLFELAVSGQEGDAQLHVAFDFLVADAWSFGILARELAALYADPDAALPDLAIGFRDYVLAERAAAPGAERRRAEAFWRTRIPDLPPAPQLPLARAPETLERPRFRRHVRRIDVARRERLREGAAARGITESALVLAAYAETLALWATAPAFTVNLTVFDRRPWHPDVERIVGDFTSVLLVGLDMAGARPFAERARDVQARLAEALDHRAMSGVAVMREVNALHPGEGLRSMPIVLTSKLGLATESPGGPIGERLHGVSRTPQVWLDAQVAEAPDGGLRLEWDVVDELFPEGSIDAMLDTLAGTLARLADEPGAWDRALPDAAPATDRALVARTNATETPLPVDLLHAPLVARAREEGGRVAVVAADGARLGRAGLVAAAGALAGRIAAAIPPGVGVPVLVEKGPAQIVAVLAALLAGRAYVPVDPTQGAERVRAILAVVGAPAALVEAGTPDFGVARIVVDTTAAPARPLPLPDLASLDDPAYVIFTSGSTGTPKGVVTAHRGAANTCLDVNARFGIGADDVVLGLSALGFDLSVWDIFGVLGAGGRLVLPDRAGLRDPEHWLALMEREGVTVWNSAPALMRMLADYCEARGRRLPDALRLVLLSGDWIPTDLPARLGRLAPGARLVSLGGATEASIWSILHEMEPRTYAPSVPYGTPMANQTMHVRDDRMRERPLHATGELWIGGVGLADGYLGDPGTTRARFVRDPVDGRRLYRTGDLGRRLPDGTIEFQGRVDFQVKIQGYRVELGEIEAALRALPAVADCVVTADGARMGPKRLVAYVVPADPDRPPAHAALADALAARLPSYMVPALWVDLRALPLSSNGKVDRKRLPAPLAVQAQDRPLTATQRLVADIYAEVLGLDAIDPQASFFALGGASVEMVRVQTEILRRAGREVPIADLFRYASAASLGAHLDASARPAAPAQAPPASPAAADRTALRARRAGARAAARG
ncbi:non-ribosomal peptide synthetase [Salinarimonas rosea]|uniref:non-ribosomal peptide synthetase n=1 Tax=Salinarimonas rosea TaxID=552063 RepID=UPI0005BA5754|nr:non-ribosomal peptide synthetase [Salinarimonas rosea]